MIEFQEQDFFLLQEGAFRKSKPFRDPLFPKELFLNLEQEALRPKGIVKKPQEPVLFIDNKKPFHVKQGKLGDCWFVVGLVHLQYYPNLFKFIVSPYDQTFDVTNYAGIFHFRFWQAGAWVDVVIDDRLPTEEKQLVYTSSGYPNEFWPALVEKAYAKLMYRSYEKLDAGFSRLSMQDLSGGISETYVVKSTSNSLFEIIQDAKDRSTMISCSTVNEKKFRTSVFNLDPGHSYAVTSVKILTGDKTNNTSGFKLIRIRNPYGIISVDLYHGVIKDLFTEATLASKLDIEMIGESWILYDDFIKYFSCVEICNLTPNQITGITSSNTGKKLALSAVEGKFMGAVTTKQVVANDFYNINPQYRMVLTKTDEGKKICTVLIGVSLKRRHDLEKVSINSIYFRMISFDANDDSTRVPKPLATSSMKYHEFGPFRSRGQLTEYKHGEIIELQQQDFLNLRKEAFKESKLFEDPQFPKELFLNIGEKDSRPTDIVEKPQEPVLFIDNKKAFHVKQGRLGDCWFVVGLLNLQNYPNLFQFIVSPYDQTFDGTNYAGIFHFRFWQAGVWVDVVIDDRLPTEEKQLVYTSSGYPNEFWPALVEKAYAKLMYRSYKKLDHGFSRISMQDLSGGISETYLVESTSNNLFGIIQDAKDRSTMISSTTFKKKEFKKFGTSVFSLHPGHSYAITALKLVTGDKTNGEFRLVRIRDPYGIVSVDLYHGVIKDLFTEATLASKLETKNDGESWILYEDFSKYFSYVQICNLTPNQITNHVYSNTGKKLALSAIEGKFMEAVTLKQVVYNDFFTNSPQYRMVLTKSDEVLIGVSLKRRHDLQKISISSIYFRVISFDADDASTRVPKPLVTSSMKYHEFLSFKSRGQVSKRINLEPGHIAQELDDTVVSELELLALKKFVPQRKLSRLTIAKTILITQEVFENCGDPKFPGYIQSHSISTAFEQAGYSVNLDVVNVVYTLFGSFNGLINFKDFMLIVLAFKNKIGSNCEEFNAKLCQDLMLMVHDGSTKLKNFNDPKIHELRIDEQQFKLIIKFIKNLEGIFYKHASKPYFSVAFTKLKNLLDAFDYKLTYNILATIFQTHGNDVDIFYNQFVQSVVDVTLIFEKIQEYTSGEKGENLNKVYHEMFHRLWKKKTEKKYSSDNNKRKADEPADNESPSKRLKYKK
ncbi:hypothetical protein HCN44_004673 [Aphidius gifuensis]|uniref:Calpain catalytic domain-containing protein n=1 Tax=Aphidius gifuensis TaxID=684658 RepID=A0A834XYI9_APHGI|nr:hypothetical protein HCN44_004673 [Aphidius gifuensis]